VYWTKGILKAPKNIEIYWTTLHCCIITSAQNDTEGLKLLSLMGMPFREPGGGRSSASAAKKKT
jgi:hypothetical protein